MDTPRPTPPLPAGPGAPASGAGRTRLLRASALVGLLSLVFGFLIAYQIRAEVIPPRNQVARNEALRATVIALETTNQTERARVEMLRAEVDRLEAEQARKSDSLRLAQAELQRLKVQGALTSIHGPGVTVVLDDGRPDPSGKLANLVTYQDVQDVVNTLFQAGADGVAVNGHRLSPISALSGSRDTLIVDQSEPMMPPFRVTAVGNRNLMEQTLADGSVLADLRRRQRLFQLGFGWQGVPDLILPAYDASLALKYARPA